MLDPIGAFERIRANFLLYVKTAFSMRKNGKSFYLKRVFCRETLGLSRFHAT